MASRTRSGPILSVLACKGSTPAIQKGPWPAAHGRRRSTSANSNSDLAGYDEVYQPIAGRGIGCDVVPCTVDAWKEADLDAGSVLRDALDEGILLYGQP